MQTPSLDDASGDLTIPSGLTDPDVTGFDLGDQLTF